MDMYVHMCFTARLHSTQAQVLRLVVGVAVGELEVAVRLHHLQIPPAVLRTIPVARGKLLYVYVYVYMSVYICLFM